MNKVMFVKEIKKSCGSCTACCSGLLYGEAHGHHFFKGRPCFFLTEKGCGIYEDRPEQPCVSYKCSYLSEAFFPEWMRPDLCGVLATNRVHKYIVDIPAKDDQPATQQEKFVPYMHLVEHKTALSGKTLMWFVTRYMEGAIPNLLIDIEGGQHRLGSAEFLAARL